MRGLGEGGGGVQVNLKLFTPAPGKRRTVLLFVFRDRTKTPLPRLIETWQEDLNRMWAAILKPPQYESTSVTDFFEVTVHLIVVDCDYLFLKQNNQGTRNGSRVVPAPPPRSTAPDERMLGSREDAGGSLWSCR